MISLVLTGGVLTPIAADIISGSVNGSTVIGMVASAPGQAGVLIDGARVSSNATLFDGSRVTATGYSRLQLSSGTRVDLGADSVVRVFASRAVLESGASEVQSASGYVIDARWLRIQPSRSASIARVRLDGDQRVLVTALTAPVNVWNGKGVLVARVMPMSPMSFLPQASVAGTPPGTNGASAGAGTGAEAAADGGATTGAAGQATAGTGSTSAAGAAGAGAAPAGIAAAGGGLGGVAIGGVVAGAAAAVGGTAALVATKSTSP